MPEAPAFSAPIQASDGTSIPVTTVTVTVNSLSATIAQDAGGLAGKIGIAGKAWPAASVLTEYWQWRLVNGAGEDGDPLGVARVDGRRVKVLELGSGTGVAGILLGKSLDDAVARQGRSRRCDVYVTDLGLAMPLIERNVEANAVGSEGTDGVRVIPRRLDWGIASDAEWFLSEGAGVDIIFATDVVYYPSLFQPLIATLCILTDPSRVAVAPEVIICNKFRELSKELGFYRIVGKHFHIEIVGEWGAFWERWREAGFVLFRLRRRERALEEDGSDEFEALMMSWMADGAD